MPLIKYGFTGTRNGLNNTQKQNLIELFNNTLTNNKIVSELEIELEIELHHGDCIGADQDIHEICETKSINVIIHPPIENKLRAFCKSKNICEELTYLQRNKKIVDDTNILIACPYSNQEQIRSGVWSTIRYARKKNKPIIIFV